MKTTEKPPKGWNTVVNVFYPSQIHKTNFNFSVTLILSSANAFNLDQPKILSFGKEIKGSCRVTKEDEVHQGKIAHLTISCENHVKSNCAFINQ